MKSHNIKIFLACSLIFLCLLFAHAKYIHRMYNPKAAFEKLFNIDLPDGIKILSYDWSYTDNFLHVSQYFLFEGQAEELERFSAQLKVVISSEDAIHAFPKRKYLFDLDLSQYSIKSGFESEG